MYLEYCGQETRCMSATPDTSNIARVFEAYLAFEYVACLKRLTSDTPGIGILGTSNTEDISRRILRLFHTGYAPDT